MDKKLCKITLTYSRHFGKKKKEKDGNKGKNTRRK